MSEEKKKKMIHRYNLESYIDTYDRRYREDQFFKMALISYYIDEKRFVGNILDFGAGTGLFWEFLNSIKKKEKIHYVKNDLSNIVKSSKIQYIAIDIAENMLKKLKTKYIKEKELQKMVLGINLIVADGENLPFREESINQVYSFTSIQNLDNIKQGINEIKRVLPSRSNSEQQNLNKLEFNAFITYLKKSTSWEELQKIISSVFNSYKNIIAENIYSKEKISIDYELKNLLNRLEDWIIIA